MIQLPPLASSPRRQHFTARTNNGQHQETVLASTAAQVERHFAKLWGVRGTEIVVASRPDLNQEFMIQEKKRRPKTAAARAAQARWQKKPEVMAVRAEKNRRTAQIVTIRQQLADGSVASILAPRKDGDVAAIREVFPEHRVVVMGKRLYVALPEALIPT